MKALILSAWAWVVAHPAEVAGFIGSVLSAIAAATVANARAKGAPVGWFARFVDRLAVKTRQGAKNEGWSWPAFGRSVFEAAIDASTPERDKLSKEIFDSIEPVAERETQAPPPPSEPGYAEQWVLGAIALVAVVALAISGCAAGQTPVLSPIAPRVVSDPLYGTCVEVGGKLTVGEVAIAQLSRTCLLMDAAVNAIDASSPEPEAIVDKGDAGTSE